MNNIFDFTKTFGALSVRTASAIFFDDNGYYKDFYRNGEWIASAHYTANGERISFEFIPVNDAKYDSLTRAKGFRYWEKHFPHKTYCWQLPELLQEALELPCVSEGTFYDKNGELCGYMG